MWRLTLIALLFSFSAFAQSDTTVRQVEVSGLGYKLYGVFYSQYSIGVNFPAKKDKWYNNLALSVNIQDATKRDGAMFSLYSLSVGKSYQRINNHFFGTLGFNTGPFYGIFTADEFVIRHIGINGIPKAEIGYNMKKTVLSTGIYFSMGFGYRAEYEDGEFVKYPKANDYVRFTGALNLYLKLILK